MSFALSVLHNLTSPYTSSSGCTASIGVGPEISHMVAHTAIASSPSYEVLCMCVCARIWQRVCMCTLAASLFYSGIVLSSSVRGPQGLALRAPEMKSSVYVRQVSIPQSRPSPSTHIKEEMWTTARRFTFLQLLVISSKAIG